MNLIEIFSAIPRLFDWYLAMPLIKRIQINYITLLALVIGFSYYNDKRHTDNYAVLSSRIDSINNSRAKEQEKYTAKLEYYTDKFNSLLVVLIQQKKEIKQIKEEQ